MKTRLFLMLMVGMLAVSSCKKEPIQHESPNFLAVVDSICNEYACEDNEGFHAPTVEIRFNDYMRSCTADKNPIFKDIPFTVENAYVDHIYGNKVASISLSYNNEAESGNHKRLYKLYLDTETMLAEDETVNVKKGEKYFVKPQATIPDIIYELSHANSAEGRDGGWVDVLSFAVKMREVKLIPAE